MQTDTVKLWFTYAIVLVIVLGGGAFLLATRLDPPGTSQDLQLAIVGFIGSAVTFVFTRETQTQTARATAAAISQGAGNGNGQSGQVSVPYWLWIVIAAILILVLFMLIGHPIRIT